ncbi:unnamed protein product [Arctogadus glacialis]
MAVQCSSSIHLPRICHVCRPLLSWGETDRSRHRSLPYYLRIYDAETARVQKWREHYYAQLHFTDSVSTKEPLIPFPMAVTVSVSPEPLSVLPLHPSIPWSRAALAPYDLSF